MAEILMIDQFESVRELIRQELADDGHSVDGVETLTQAQHVSASRSYDVVLIDPYCHFQETRDLLGGVKSFLPHIPIIAFSAYRSPGVDEWLKTAQDFVIKSSDFKVLKKSIERWTSKEKPIRVGGRHDNA